MRKEMTFTDLLVLLLKKFNAILIVAIVAGIVLGGSGIALLVAHYSNAETKAELQEKFNKNAIGINWKSSVRSCRLLKIGKRCWMIMQKTVFSIL